MHDVDLVALPKDIKGLKARCTRACEVLADGLQNYRIKTASGVQLEIYFAQPESPDLFKPTPSTWGTLLLCRTGSRQHNIHLVEYAKSVGLRWSPYAGVFDKDFNFFLYTSACARPWTRWLVDSYCP